MRTQVWIIAAAFFVFGVLGWVLEGRFSPVFLGLMGIGIAGFILGALTSD
jgi:hypothetical protein